MPWLRASTRAHGEQAIWHFKSPAVGKICSCYFSMMQCSELVDFFEQIQKSKVKCLGSHYEWWILQGPKKILIPVAPQELPPGTCLMWCNVFWILPPEKPTRKREHPYTKGVAMLYGNGPIILKTLEDKDLDYDGYVLSQVPCNLYSWLVNQPLT